MSSDYPDYSPQGQKQVDWKKRILDLQDLQDWQGLRDWRRQWTKKEGRQGIQTNRVEVALTENRSGIGEMRCPLFTGGGNDGGQGG